MINLLPPEEKRQIQAARSNTLLLRYNIVSISVLVFLLAAIATTYVYLTNTKASAEQTISENKERVSDYASVEAEATEFRSSLSTAKQILDQEIVYSKLVLDIAKLIPQGVVLKQLNLDAQSFGAETVLTAEAKDEKAATSLKDSLASSPLFSNVHFQSLTADGAATGDYPYTVTLGVTIQKGAAK